jgi:hypothetical protein
MNILKKTQNALVAWLADQSLPEDLPAANIYKGIDNPVEEDNITIRETRNLPCVICECDRAEIKEYRTGNYTAFARVVVKASADDFTDNEFSELCDGVTVFIETTSIAADLSGALEDYTAHVVRIKGQGYRIVGRTWEHYLDLEVDCCGADIS